MRYEVRTTMAFRTWLKRLRDLNARTRVADRIRRVEAGNFGDHKFLPGDLGELRVNAGPGYRVNFTTRGSVVFIALVGGDKSTQQRGIERGRQMINDL